MLGTRQRRALLSSLTLLLAGCGRPTSLDDLQTPVEVGDIYVATDGDDDNAGTLSTLPLATINQAMEIAATWPDEEAELAVVIATGTYEEDVRIPSDVTLVLSGGFDARDAFGWVQVADPELTIIAGADGPAIFVESGATVTIENLTLNGGPGAAPDLVTKGFYAPLALGGALVAQGAEVEVTDSILEGLGGEIGQLRAAAAVVPGWPGGTLTRGRLNIRRSTLRGGDQCSDSAGLFCGETCSCEVRDSPLIEGGVLSRQILEDPTQQGTAHAITAYNARQLVVNDNASIIGPAGNVASAIWAMSVYEVSILDNDHIEAGDGLFASSAIALLDCAGFLIDGNGVLQGGAGDASAGLDIWVSNGQVGENLLIAGGAGRAFSAGIAVAGTTERGSAVIIHDNQNISAGSAAVTAGIDVFGRVGGEIKYNRSIDGGIATAEACGLRLDRAGHTASPLMIQGNHVYSGSGETAVGLYVQGLEPVITNNAIVANGAITRQFGLFLDGAAGAVSTSPLVAYNTIAAVAPTQTAEALSPRPFNASIGDYGSEARVIGNLVLTEWPRATLLWFPNGPPPSDHRLNAYLAYGTAGEESFALLHGDDPAAPGVGTVPATGTPADLSADPAVTDAATCNPDLWLYAWRASLGDLHLGAASCQVDDSCPDYDCAASDCVGAGPGSATIASYAYERGFPLRADWFLDFDGDPRPLGGDMDFGADECVP